MAVLMDRELIAENNKIFFYKMYMTDERNPLILGIDIDLRRIRVSA